MATCNDPHASPNELNRLIALDPSLAGQVLRLINSACYSLNQPVSSLSRAIIMLGINTVKNLVLSLAILDHFHARKPFRTLCGAPFWKHCVAVGVITKSLAVLKGVSWADQEDYFVCGLMHDLGKLPLKQQFDQEYSEAMDLAARRSWTMAHAERTIFGIDHSAIGGLIAQKWRLSSAFIDVLSYHHQPDDASAGKRLQVQMVALANRYAPVLEHELDEDALAKDPLAALLMTQIDVEPSKLVGIRDRVLADIDNAKIFLEIADKETGFYH